MAILEKTRKILWGRSGNRCAICKTELVLERTQMDPEVIVGEECHIAAQSEGGPRYDPDLGPQSIDAYENLILLCGIHHKQVDDQYNTFSTSIIHQIKKEHENWVKTTLAKENDETESTEPTYLQRTMSGAELFNLVDGCHEFGYIIDTIGPGAEKNQILEFLQTAADYGDISDSIFGITQREEINDFFATELQRLEDLGYWVFIGREVLRKVGYDGKKWNWIRAIIKIVKSDDQSILML